MDYLKNIIALLFGLGALIGGPALADCPNGTQKSIFFGTIICAQPVAGLPANSDLKIDANDPAERYYGYVTIQTVGDFTLKDRNAVDEAVSFAKSVLGIKDSYQAAYAIEIDIEKGGVSTPIATIPLVNYYIQDGILDSNKSQTFQLNNGQVGGAFSLRSISNSNLKVHFKVAITKNLSFSQTELLSALGAATSATPGGWLANPIIAAAVKSGQSATSDLLSQSIITETVSNLGVGRSDNAVLTFIPPIGSGGVDSQLQVTLSFRHKQSFTQLDGATGIPNSYDPNLASSIILNSGNAVPTTLESIVETLGLPVKGLISAQVAPAGASAKSVIEANCAAIESAFDNTQFISLSRYDIEAIKYSYFNIQMPDGGYGDASNYPAKCVSAIWKDYGFNVSTPDPPGVHTLTETAAKPLVAKLALAMSNPTLTGRAGAFGLLKSDTFTVKSQKSFFPSDPDVQARFSCSDAKGERCFAGHEAFETLHICKLGTPFKNGHANDFGDSDINQPTGGDPIDFNTLSVSAHALLDGSNAANTIRVVFDTDHNIKEVALGKLRDDEIQFISSPVAGNQPWVKTDPDFVSAADAAAMTAGTFHCN